ncbi:hypothetical protein CEE69_13525 [Rhodopirellula bahusiensis]|uniref:Lipoprotein n=1 Tax=Rhodopirellula bahusiensis TaxID=2014065 RepID=A0A2G1W789_9BACT|nr:hypothetical protein CEE69_13525 [Rhodopirellula bahusiensis]
MRIDHTVAELTSMENETIKTLASVLVPVPILVTGCGGSSEAAFSPIKARAAEEQQSFAQYHEQLKAESKSQNRR